MNKRFVVLLVGAALIATNCSGGDSPGGVIDVSSSVAESDGANTAAVAESLCDRVKAGEIVQTQDGQFEVCAMESTYEVAASNGMGVWGPEASFGLSGFGLGITSGSTSLNHPSSGASDGTHLVVADRFNNRILIFNSLPLGPAEPDVVVGQPNFQDTTPGTSLADMNWPGAVEITPSGQLLVADTENGRILVFNQVPSSNGASADFALDLEALTGESDAWPWGLWSDGSSLVVTDTRKGNVLVWDEFPASANAKPSAVTNPNGVGTPRNVTSDGKNFLIGDENGSQTTCWGMEPQNRMRQSHVWIGRLPVGDPDGCVWDWYQGDTYQGGVIALAAGGRDAHYWPAFPVDNDSSMARVTTGSSGSATAPAAVPQPDMQQPVPVEPGQPMEPGQPVEPGQPIVDDESQQSAGAPTALQDQQAGHSYLGGDGGDVVVTDKAIYFIEYNGNRVTGWTSVPESLVGKTPDFSVFDSDPKTSTLLRDGFIQNPVLVKAGNALVATSDYDRRMHVWNSFPGEDGARADYVYLMGFPAWDNSFADGTLIAAGRDSVAVWKTFVPGNLPDSVFKGSIGSLTLNDVRGVAFDGTYLAIADGDRVSVFRGIPGDNDDPIEQFDIRGPGRLDIRAGVLAIAPREGADVFVVDLGRSAKPTKLNVQVNLPMQVKFLDSGFAIADTSFHRVQIWNDVASARAGAKPSVIIGGAVGERPQTSRDRFYFPASVEEVNGTLYVGEFKFSNRILVFTR